MPDEKCETCKYNGVNGCVFTAETGEICEGKSGWEEDDTEKYISEEDRKAYADDQRYHESVDEPD